MTPEETQAELKRYREIIFAAIDYSLETKEYRVRFDDQDPDVYRYRLLKQQTETHYKNQSLEELIKIFQDLAEFPRVSGDLNFDKYINEKTGYDIDIFEGLQGRIDKIIGQKQITNETELHDVLSMAAIYQQTNADNGKNKILKDLISDFSNRSNNQSSTQPDNYFENWHSETYSPNGKFKMTIVEQGMGENNGQTNVCIDFELMSVSIFSARGIGLHVKCSWKDDEIVVLETKEEYLAYLRGRQKLQQVRIGEHVIKIEYREPQL